MSDVFISYSRKNGEFVQRLNNAFIAAKRVAWVDWQNIPRGEDWWIEIVRGIEDADAFICTISENWLMSEICHKEMEHALKHHKRILPLVRQQIEGEVEERVKAAWMGKEWEKLAKDNWDAIRHLNWIFFDTEAKFTGEFNALLKTLDEDQPYIKAHTHYATNARQWENSGRNPSFLMDGDQMTVATKWLENSTEKEPQPTDLHRTFILESRAAEEEKARVAAQMVRRTKRLRLASIVASVVGGLALLATVGATTLTISAQNNAATATYAQGQANQREATATVAQGRAEANADEANIQVAYAGATLTQIPPILTAVAQRVSDGETRLESVRLASLANDELLNYNPINSTLLSLRSLNVSYTSQAETILFRALTENHAHMILGGNTANFLSGAYSPDGRFIATGSYDGAIIWDAETGAHVQTLSVNQDAVTSIVYSPDGRNILTGSNYGTITSWDIETGQPIWTLSSTGTVIDSVYSPNGDFVVTVVQGDGAFIRDASTGEEVQSLRVQGGVSCAAYSPNGRTIATGNNDGTITIWNARTGSERQTLSPALNLNGVYDINYSPDGQNILSVFYGNPIIWDADTGEQLRVLQTSNGAFIQGGVYSPDGQHIATSGWDGRVILWDAATGANVGEFQGSSFTGTTAIYSPDGDYLFIIYSDGTSTVLDTNATGQVPTLDGDTGELTYAVYSPDGQQIITANGSGTYILWDAESREPVRRLDTDDGYLRTLSYSPDGRFIAAASYIDGLIIRDSRSLDEVQTLMANGGIASAEYSPDGRYIVTAGGDGTASIWDVQRGDEVRTLRPQGAPLWTATYSPDGQYIVTGDEGGTVIIWDADSGDQVHTLVGHTTTVFDAVYSPDGRHIVTVGDDQIAIIWDADSGEQLRVLQVHGVRVLNVAYSPDGQYLVTTDFNGTVIIWDAATGEQVRVLQGNRMEVRSVAYSPDGRTIVTASPDGTAIIWYTDYRDFITYACDRLALIGDFTLAERQRFQLDYTATCPQFGSMSAALAQLGENAGEIVDHGGQLWNYTGQAGETLTISVNADDASVLDTVVLVRSPEGAILAQNDDSPEGGTWNSLIEDLELPVDGIYEIIISSYNNASSGTYALEIASDESSE